MIESYIYFKGTNKAKQKHAEGGREMEETRNQHVYYAFSFLFACVAQPKKIAEWKFELWRN